MSDVKQTAHRLVAEIDEQEVAVIIAEACCRMHRTGGQTAAQALEEIKAYSPAIHEEFTTAARRVMLYIKNQIDRGTIVRD